MNILFEKNEFTQVRKTNALVSQLNYALVQASKTLISVLK
jgi:hypothetical protein